MPLDKLRLLKLHLVLVVLLLPLACSHLPEIHAPQGVALADHAKRCERIFPEGRWQFLHSIEAVPPDGASHTLLGVIQLSSSDRSLHCIMMTVEGLVVLDAAYDGAVRIQRAVPPMDRPGLAEGVIRDLRLIFYPPEKPAHETGFLEDGDRICRYALPDGGVQDIRVHDEGAWAIQRYTANGRLTRTVRSDPDAPLSPLGFPGRLMLQAHGLLGYRLRMTLLEELPLGSLN